MSVKKIIIIIMFFSFYSCDPQEDRMLVENNTLDIISFEIRDRNQSIILPKRKIQSMSKEKVIKLSSWESVYDNLKPDSLMYVYISRKINQDSIVYYKTYSYEQLNLKKWHVKFPEDDFIIYQEL